MPYSVPDSSAFAFSDVCNAVYGVYLPGVQLFGAGGAFESAVPGYFDSRYLVDKSHMSEFRNYGPPQYVFTQSVTSINEDEYGYAQFHLQVIRGHIGEQFFFTLSGTNITLNDIHKMYINGVEITPSLNGMFTLVAPGTWTAPDGNIFTSGAYPVSFLWISAKADLLTEGPEFITCTLWVNSQSLVAAIVDTSTTPPPPPIPATPSLIISLTGGTSLEMLGAVHDIPIEWTESTHSSGIDGYHIYLNGTIYVTLSQYSLSYIIGYMDLIGLNTAYVVAKANDGTFSLPSNNITIRT